MTITATVVVGAHNRGDMKSAERRRGKPVVTRRFGEEVHRDTGTWRRVERTIDRNQNRYCERIIDEHGEVVREVDEPLDKHQGHGCAKNQGASPV